MKLRAALALAPLLAGCSPEPAPAPPGTGLENAAIERGVIRDPAARTLTGLYAREGDRLCVIERGGTTRIGAFIDYGDGIGCTGRGGVTQTGERLRIDFGRGCAFDAAFDGDHLRFSGTVPAACEMLCTRRASLAGIAMERLSDSVSEAEALRDPRGTPLCG